MRHLVGIILAIVLAAALFLAAGWGIAHLYGTLAPARGLISITGLLALSALLATGLFLGILLAVRAISLKNAEEFKRRDELLWRCFCLGPSCFSRNRWRRIWRCQRLHCPKI